MLEPGAGGSSRIATFLRGENCLLVERGRLAIGVGGSGSGVGAGELAGGAACLHTLLRGLGLGDDQFKSLLCLECQLSILLLFLEVVGDSKLLVPDGLLRLRLVENCLSEWIGVRDGELDVEGSEQLPDVGHSFDNPF